MLDKSSRVLMRCLKHHSIFLNSFYFGTSKSSPSSIWAQANTGELATAKLTVLLEHFQAVYKMPVKDQVLDEKRFCSDCILSDVPRVVVLCNV